MPAEEHLTDSSSLCGTLPLLVDLSDDLTPQSLCRARMYVNLLTNPPLPPHPFGIFLEEASRLKTAVKAGVGATESSSSDGPVITSDTNNGNEGIGISNGTDRAPSLLEALQHKHGYSSGSALYRVWVQGTQDYLSLIAQRIADAVLTHAIPLVVHNMQRDPHSSHSVFNDNKKRKTDIVSKQSSQYDIHVRFLPSPSPRTMVDPSLAQAFCAEIIVRDVTALRRREEATALLRARYTAVAAEGQTVQSALTFWRAVHMDAAVDEGEEEEEEKEGGNGEGRKDKVREYDDDDDGGGGGENAISLGIGSSAAVVLGHRSAKTATTTRLCGAQYGEGNKARDEINAERGEGGESMWVQPEVKHTRPFNVPLHGIPHKRQRMMRRDSTTTTTAEAPRGPLQSTAGLVAVFYLAANAVLYTGTGRGVPRGGICVRVPHPLDTIRGDEKTENRECRVHEDQAEETPLTRDAESVVFLPCASSASFLRGLLGL